MMRPAGQQVAVVGDRGDLAHVVRDDDAADAERVVEAPDEPQHHAHRDRVEPDERLVVHEQLGIHHDRARERDAPRHAARELRTASAGPRRAARRPAAWSAPGGAPGAPAAACARAAGTRCSRRRRGRSAARRSGTACPCGGACGTAPRATACATSWPSNSTRPRSGRAWPVMSRSSVVLPLPLGPMTAVTAPRGKSRSTPEKISRPPAL